MVDVMAIDLSLMYSFFISAEQNLLYYKYLWNILSNVNAKFQIYSSIPSWDAN